MAQIALDLKVGVETVSDGVAVLQVAAEFAVQRRFRQIGDVRCHPRHREAARRVMAEAQITSAAPIRIGDNRLAADFMKGNVLRRMTRRAGDRHRRHDRLGVARGPLQDLHRPHRPANDTE